MERRRGRRRLQGRRGPQQRADQRRLPEGQRRGRDGAREGLARRRDEARPRDPRRGRQDLGDGRGDLQDRQGRRDREVPAEARRSVRRGRPGNGCDEAPRRLPVALCGPPRLLLRRHRDRRREDPVAARRAAERAVPPPPGGKGRGDRDVRLRKPGSGRAVHAQRQRRGAPVHRVGDRVRQGQEGLGRAPRGAPDLARGRGQGGRLEKGDAARLEDALPRAVACRFHAQGRADR